MPKKKKGSIFEGRLDREEEGFEAEPEQFLEPEEHPETSEEFVEKMAAGLREVSIYTEEGREELEEADELEKEELGLGAMEGFIEGAEERGEHGTCAHCGKPLSQDRSKIIEREIEHELKLFCSNACAAACLAKHKPS